MNTHSMQAAAVLLASVIAACTTTGTGSGATRNGADQVAFAWSTNSSIKGNITATLQDSQQMFSGTYFQITSETRVDELRPLWVGWRHWRGEWGYWGASAGTGFVTHYSGHVLANLEGANGAHMRCDFHLIHPAYGMSGGGMGRCQMPDGKTIDAMFPGK